MRDKPRLAEVQRRCESAKPLGMFRSTEMEFLLCYDCESGLPWSSMIRAHTSFWSICRQVSSCGAPDRQADDTGTESQTEIVKSSNGKDGPIPSVSTRLTCCSARRPSSRSGILIPPSSCRSTRAAISGSHGSESISPREVCALTISGTGGQAHPPIDNPGPK